MKKIKLSLPPEGFTVQDAYDASKREGSLSQIVMDIIIQNRKELKLRWREKDSPRQKTEGFCEAINKNFQETREEIDQKVMDYLLRHDGKADSWPDCAGLDEMNWEDVQTGPVAFDYFGDDYQVTGPHSDSELYIISRKQDELVYHNTYIPEHLPAYNAKRKEVEYIADKLRNAGPIRQRCLPLLCLLFFLLSLFTGLASLALISEMTVQYISLGSLRPMMLEWGLTLGEGFFPNLIRDTLSWLFFPSVMYRENLSSGVTEGAVAYALIAFVLTLIMLGLLVHYLRLLPLKWKVHRLKKEIREMEPENLLWEESCRKISEEWHQAWFKWAQEYKMRPGVTRTGCLLRGMSADDERKLREAIRDVFGVRVRPEMDIVDWNFTFSILKRKHAQHLTGNDDPDFDGLPEEMQIQISQLIIQDMLKEGYVTELPPT